jgi:dienelactone hydrolase
MTIQELEYSVGGKSFVGHLAYAEVAQGRGARPGVLVCHDAGGLRDHAKERANRLAELGYVAFALDLFGEPIRDVEHAQATIAALTNDRAPLRARLNAGLTALKSLTEVDATRTAAIGFCFGGTAALELARSGAELACAVAFHGLLGTTAPDDARHIRGKVLACVGARDPLIPAAQRDSFLAEMTGNNVDFQLLVLNAVHGFTDRSVDSHGVWALAYDERADRRSWRAMLGLFEEVFGAG